MLCIYALSDAKAHRTFAGNALSLRIVRRKSASHFCWKCSGIKPRLVPAAFGLGEDHTIMQAEGTIVPELDANGYDTETRPVWWARNFPNCVAGGIFCDSLFKREAAFERP